MQIRMELPPFYWRHKKATLEIAKYLIEKGADVNHAREDGVTALILAAHQGHPEVVEYLMIQGADINAKMKDGKTALDLAESSTEEILKLISQLSHLAQDTDPEVRNRAKVLMGAKKERNSWLRRELWNLEVDSFLAHVQKGKYKNVAIGSQSEKESRILALMDHPDPFIHNKVETIALIQDPKEQERKLKNLEDQAAKSTARLTEAVALEAQLKAKMRESLKPLLTHQNEQIRRGAEQLLYGEIGPDFEKKVCAFEAQADKIEAQMKYKEPSSDEVRLGNGSNTLVRRRRRIYGYQELEEMAQRLLEKSASLTELVDQLPACPSRPLHSESSRKAPAKKKQD